MTPKSKALSRMTLPLGEDAPGGVSTRGLSIGASERERALGARRVAEVASELRCCIRARSDLARSRKASRGIRLLSRMPLMYNFFFITVCADIREGRIYTCERDENGRTERSAVVLLERVRDLAAR